MKIAISGAHSQGKTTLVGDLKEHAAFKKFTVLGNITRGIQERGVPINELGGDWSQSLVIAKHIEHYFTKGDILLDRCMLDGIVYTDALYFHEKRVSEVVRNYAEFCFKEIVLKKKYDVIFYVEPTLPLEHDKVRSVDQEFFRNVKELFNAYITGYKVDVVRVSGDRPTRVNQVIEHLKSKYE